MFEVKLKIPFGKLKDKPASECNEGELAGNGYDDQSFVAYPELHAALKDKLKPKAVEKPKGAKGQKTKTPASDPVSGVDAEAEANDLLGESDPPESDLLGDEDESPDPDGDEKPKKAKRAKKGSTES